MIKSIVTAAVVVLIAAVAAAQGLSTAEQRALDDVEKATTDFNSADSLDAETEAAAGVLAAAEGARNAFAAANRLQDDRATAAHLAANRAALAALIRAVRTLSTAAERQPHPGTRAAEVLRAAEALDRNVSAADTKVINDFIAQTDETLEELVFLARETVVHLFRLAVAQGNAYAQANLGLMYSRGRGVERDDSEAVRLYRLAVAQGHAFAQYHLGLMYSRGRGVERDDSEAVRLYRLAVAQGHAFAQYHLGLMYSRGRGVERDDSEAVRLFRLAVAQGNAFAQANLGFMYSRGRGVERDDSEAVRLYRLAVAQGHASAPANLGFMYSRGRGVERDDSEAVRLFRLAVAQGNAFAQANLGLMYSRGRGVERDDSEAVRLYRLAVAQGNAFAQANLDAMLARPQVTAVRLSTEHRVNDTYGLGEEICIVVEFNEPVIVAGTPTLKLEIGDDVRDAAYRYSGQSLHQHYCYTVSTTDHDSDGVSVPRNAMHLPAPAYIRNVAGDDAMLHLDDFIVTNDGRHRVDGGLDRAPVVTGLTVASSPTGSAYGEGDLIRFRVTFSKAVAVTGWPSLVVTIGSAHRHAVADLRTRVSDFIEYAYIVRPGDLDTNGFSVKADALRINDWDRAFEIRDAQGNEARLDLGEHAILDAAGHAVDARPPAIDRVLIETHPGYTPGKEIRVALVFDEEIVVSPTGPPRIRPYVPLLLDGHGEEAERHAVLEPSASGGHYLRFSYEVRSGDLDIDGIGIGGLVLSGWRIIDHAGNPALIDSTSQTQHPGHKVGFILIRDDCDACPWMIELPGGILAKPATPVQIASFAIGQTEVTRAQFGAFVAATGHEVAAGCHLYREKGWGISPKTSWRSLLPGGDDGDDHPVTCIGYDDALAFVRYLSEETGHSYSLPTYDQWEFAARGGTTTRYHWGDDPNEACKYENVADKTGNWRGHMGCADGVKFAAQVGRYKANPFGLYDLIANVEEYLLGCSATAADASCSRRWLAGWNFSSFGLEQVRNLSNRHVGRPGTPRSYVGFRVTRAAID